MKRGISVFFVILSMLSIFTTLITFSGNQKSIKVFANDNIESLLVESKSAYLIDFDSGVEMYKKDELEHKTIASMCKIMTLNLCFDAIKENKFNFDTEIKVSKRASQMGGSQVFLEANANYKAYDLIKSIVVASANDSSVAMAEYIAGSEENFVSLMNEKAKSLNMENTNFVNATGLPKEGQYSCAKDVAIMLKELIKNPKYFEFSTIWLDYINHSGGRHTEMANTNKLIKYYSGCDGGKTGYTTESGFCLAATANRDGMRLISVVIDAPTSKARFKSTSNLFNFGFENYTSKLVIDSSCPLDLEVKIENGKQNSIKVKAVNSFKATRLKTEKIAIESEFIPKENLKAPINIGDIVGSIVVYKNGVSIGEVLVESIESVCQKTYFDIVFIFSIGKIDLLWYNHR